jgi:hypothetical protein
LVGEPLVVAQAVQDLHGSTEQGNGDASQSRCYSEVFSERYWSPQSNVQANWRMQEPAPLFLVEIDI